MKAFLAVFLVSAAMHGQLSTADAPIQSACGKAIAAPLPADLRNLPAPEKYPRCDSYSLYDAKKFAAARTCAIQERLALLARLPDSPSVLSPDHPDYGEAIPAGGLIVLSELYANGEGVERSAILAERFFCEAIETGEVEHETSQTDDILAMLRRLHALSPGSAHVDYCNTKDPLISLAGTPLTRRCEAAAQEAHAAMHESGIQEGIERAQQDLVDADAALKPVLARFSAAQMAAYRRLEKSAQHFIDVQATGDLLFMGGYGSGGLYPDEIRAGFENRVAEFAQTPPSAPRAAEFAAADTALNSVYRKLTATVSPGLSVFGTALSPEKLRQEQRAWLAYRDAFVALGITLAPSLPERAWMLPLTVARTADLNLVYEDAQRVRATSSHGQAGREAQKKRASAIP